MDAIGIFKSETKQDFLRISTGANGFDIKIEEGINLNKIDKACLIYNTEEEVDKFLEILGGLIDETRQTTQLTSEADPAY